MSWNLPVSFLRATSLSSGTKAVVGTQLGVLSIFNRNKGWGDCVDRVPGYVYFRSQLSTLFSRTKTSHVN